MWTLNNRPITYWKNHPIIKLYATFGNLQYFGENWKVNTENVNNLTKIYAMKWYNDNDKVSREETETQE